VRRRRQSLARVLVLDFGGKLGVVRIRPWPRTGTLEVVVPMEVWPTDGEMALEGEMTLRMNVDWRWE